MMMEHTTYHKVLRVSAVVFALLLVFESGLISESTTRLSQNAHMYVASAVGMSASVEPNEINQITAVLTQREKELDEREAALEEREIAVNLSTGSETDSDKAVYILSSILFILLVLILLNYTLDYLRAKEEREVVPV